MIVEKDYIKIFIDHRCPKCNKRELKFYYPNMNWRSISPIFTPISQEVECEGCGWYFEYEYEIKNIRIINQ